MATPVYLDNHATTPVDPRVLEAMLPYFREKFGNAASRSHRFGWEAESAVERARKQVAELAGARARDVVFTSGATESNNLALKGAAQACRARGSHIVTIATEHKAVLDTVKRLESDGCAITVLQPEPDGRLNVDILSAAIRRDTIVVSAMYANNEIGVLHPVREIAAACQERGVLFHCDAAQAFGKVAVSAEADGIDLLSVSAHKMYGPKGVGALIVRRSAGVHPTAQIDGGGHEGGMRSGTLNVPGIVGFGEACALCSADLASEATRLSSLRNHLLELLQTVGGIRVNGSMEHRLPGNLHVSIKDVDGDALLSGMPEVAVSAGSACNSGHDSGYVLRALGLGDEWLQCTARFGLGRFTTAEDIEYAARRVTEQVTKLRDLSPVRPS